MGIWLSRPKTFILSENGRSVFVPIGDTEIIDVSKIRPSTVTIGLFAKGHVKIGGKLTVTIPEPEEEGNKAIGYYKCKNLKNKLYVGLDGHIDEIFSWVQDSGNCDTENTVFSKTLLVEGVPGVGKSTLIRRFIELHGHEFENVIFIKADSRASMRSTFEDLALRLKVPLQVKKGKGKTYATVIDEVYEKLFEFKTLLIFDNVQCYSKNDDFPEASSLYSGGSDDGIADFMPKSVKEPLQYPKIIIISRTRDCERIAKKTIILKELAAETCKEYITQELSSISDVETIWRQLAEYSGYLIATLEGAIKAILKKSKLAATDGKSYTIEEFLDTVTECNKQNVRTSRTGIKKWDEWCQKLEVMWAPAFHVLESKHKYGKAALHVLDTLVFLSPSGVPLKLLYEMYNGTRSKAELQRAISTLQSCFLLTTTSTEIHVSPVLQRLRIEILIERSQLREKLKEFSDNYEKTLKMISSKNPENSRHVDNALHVFSQHRTKFAKFQVERLLFSIPTALEDFKLEFSMHAHLFLEGYLIRKKVSETDETRLHLAEKIIYLLDKLGKNFQALEMSQLAYQMRVRELGEAHPNAIRALALLESALAKQGKSSVGDCDVYESVQVSRNAKRNKLEEQLGRNVVDQAEDGRDHVP